MGNFQETGQNSSVSFNIVADSVQRLLGEFMHHFRMCQFVPAQLESTLGQTFLGDDAR
jgi:hypothetical protein